MNAYNPTGSGSHHDREGSALTFHLSGTEFTASQPVHASIESAFGAGTSNEPQYNEKSHVDGSTAAAAENLNQQKEKPIHLPAHPHHQANLDQMTATLNAVRERNKSLEKYERQV